MHAWSRVVMFRTFKELPFRRICCYLLQGLGLNSSAAGGSGVRSATHPNVTGTVSFSVSVQLVIQAQEKKHILTFMLCYSLLTLNPIHLCLKLYILLFILGSISTSCVPFRFEPFSKALNVRDCTYGYSHIRDVTHMFLYVQSIQALLVDLLNI